MGTKPRQLSLLLLGLGLLVSLRFFLSSSGPETSPSPDAQTGSKSIPRVDHQESPAVVVVPAQRGTAEPQAKLQDLIKAAAESLPTLSDARELPADELHHTPPAMLESARQIGQLEVAIHEDLAAVPQVISFYDDCAQNEEILTAVRALCLSNTLRWKRQLSLCVAADCNEGFYPQKVRDLARLL